MKTDDAQREVLDILTGTWRAQALYTAAELRLADHITNGHGSLEALALRTRSDPESLQRLMRLLVLLGLFETSQDSDGTQTFRPTPVGELLREGAPYSLRDMCLFYGREFHRAWGEIVPAVQSGVSGFTEAFGRPLSAYLRDVPEAGAKFQAAMSAGEAVFGAFSQLAGFSPSETVVDVGGGKGTLLSVVLREHPQLRGVLFDLPHVVESVGTGQDQTLPPERATVTGGDMFEALPEGADSYILSRVLQDWDEDSCSRILANCRKAMSGRSRLLILERVIDTGSPSVFPVMWDVHLMVVAGGRERTLDEYHSLFERNGLRLESHLRLPLDNSLLVAVPEP